MGFDVHGLDPVTRGQRPERPKDRDFFHGSSPADRAIRDEYWQAMIEFEDENPGVYFRRSSWGWRPLWEFVCNASDALTKEDHHSGSFNDAHRISKDAALQIADDLTRALESGQAVAYLKEREERIANLPNRQCDRCKGEGSELAAPIPDKHLPHGAPCRSCQGSGEQPPWESMYGMDLECIEEFRTFCSECGGFEIC